MTTPKICEGYRASLCLCLPESLTWQSQALGSAKEECVIAVKEVDGGSGGQLESGLWGSWLTTCIPAYKLSEPFMAWRLLLSPAPCYLPCLSPALNPAVSNDLSVLDRRLG